MIGMDQQLDLKEQVIDKQAQLNVPTSTGSLKRMYLPFGLQLTATCLMCVIAFNFLHVGYILHNPKQNMILSEKLVLFLYLILQCCSDFISRNPSCGLIFFSIIMNCLIIFTLDAYNLDAILIALGMLLIFVVCLSMLAILLSQNFAYYNSIFVGICLIFCILQLLINCFFWNQTLPRMITLVIGAIMFSSFTVTNFQQASGKIKSDTSVPYNLTLLRLSFSVTYLYLTELAAFTV